MRLFHSMDQGADSVARSAGLLDETPLEVMLHHDEQRRTRREQGRSSGDGERKGEGKETDGCREEGVEREGQKGEPEGGGGQRIRGSQEDVMAW